MDALTKHFRERLLLMLKDYVRNPSEKNISTLSFGMSSSTAEFSELAIREDLLLMHSIPLVITEGTIKRIQINIPTMYKTTPARLDVEEVTIRVRLLVEQRSGFNPDRTFGSSSYKEQKLKDWDDKMIKYFKELAPPTWIKKIIDNILKNMIISVKNLNIYYESFSLLSSPSLAKISLQELNMHSTSENWIPGFNSNPKIKFRELSVKGLAITLNINKKKTYEMIPESVTKKESINKSKTSMSPKPKKPIFHQHHTIAPNAPTNKLKHIAFDEVGDLESEYDKLRENDVYLLFPLDFTVRMREELDLSKDFENTPQQEFLVDVRESIILMLNKDHMRFLGALNEHLRLMNIVQKNLHLRPDEPPEKKPKEWWRYAVRAVLEERMRQSNFSKDPGSFWKRKKYIDIYKRQQNIIAVPWLPRTSESERKLFKKLEEDIPLQNLIQFREWAFIEIRVEAKRFATLNKDVQGMKPLIDIWFHILNNDDMFKSNANDSVADTIRLTMLEQTDLYEILALDKAKVLESYLKGENNDPKDISMNLKIKLNSFYIMISEPKWTSNPFKRASSVKSWWTQPWQNHNINMLASDVSAKLTVESVGHKMNLANQSPTFQSFDHEPPGHTKRPDHVALKVAVNDDDRSHISMRSPSFHDHMRDIDREVESKYLINETEEDDQIEENQAETNVANLNPAISTWWNQNLLLLFEILDINTSINKYRSGRLSTEGEKPLEFGNLIITTAFNLPNAMGKKSRGSEEAGLQYESLLQSILAYDFSTVPSVGQRDTNPFISYLKANGSMNIAGFLEIYEKDKRSGGEVIVSNIKAYRQFFRNEDSMYIEQFKDETKRKYENFLKLGNAIRETKETIIGAAYNDIEDYILKNVLPPFLFSHGILVLPLILQANTLFLRDQEITSSIAGKIDMVFRTLKNVPTQLNVLSKSFLGKMTKKMASQELTDATLNLSFDIEGRESKFKIKKIDLPTSRLHSPQLFGKGLIVDLVEDKETNEGQSFIKLAVKPIVVHLSIESLKPLVLFFKSFSQNHNTDMANVKNEGADAASVKNYEKMIDCIHYNKDREKEIQFDEGPKLEAKFKSIIIKISNYIPNYRQTRELNFSFTDILYKVKNPNSSELAPSLETKRLQTYYRAKSLRIEEISLQELAAGEHINILKAGIIFYFYDCLYKNHPLYTDSKIHALIPFFNLTIDDGALLFLQTVKLVNILLSNPPKKNSIVVPKRNTEDLVMGMNQRNMLINRFKVLRNDHKESNKACKHCILRYKKSQTVLNLFFGDLGKYCSTLIATPFHNLYSVMEKGSSGDLGLTISMTHSLARTDEKVSQTLLYIPFVSVTRDQGFFKDNLIIHCTESSKHIGTAGKGSIDFEIKPMIKVTNQFMANLDEKFWRYFKDFEKFYRHKDDKSRIESMPSVEHSNSSSIKSEKLGGEKLFSIDMEGTSSEKDIGEKETDNRPKVYVLVARKKILLKDLASQFDIGENDFRNFLVLKLREINIRFNSLPSFCGLKNTIDTFAYLNTWFDHFLASMSVTKQELTRGNSLKPLESGMTLPNLDTMIETEDVAVWIDKISFQIKIKPPKIVWLFEINQVSLCTNKKSNNASNQDLVDKQVWDLFSINNINFSITSSASSSGTIRNIILKYYQKIHQLKFSIENVHHSCPSRTDHSLIRIPSDSTKTKEKKALKAYLLFNEGVLSKVSVSIASIAVNVSKILLTEELCAIDVYSTISEQERGNLSEVLAREIFNKSVFLEVENSVIQSSRERDAPSNLQKMRGPHVGPLAATQDIVILVQANNLNVKLIADDNYLFAELDASPIDFMLDVEGYYEINFGEFGFHPHSSYYNNFIVGMSQAYPMNIKIKKDIDYPILSIQNSKIVYLERVMAEIKEFRRDLQNEIQAASHKVSQQPKPLRLGTDSKELKKMNSQRKVAFLKVQLDNSCVVVPRDSNSKDVFIALFERLDVLLENDIRTVDFPAELKKPLAIINKKLVIDTCTEYEKSACPVMVANVNISKLDLLYVNNGLKRAIGSAESAFVISTTPKDPLVVNQWNFDSALQAVFEKFSFGMNIACLTEIDDLVSENLKELSTVFKYKPKDLGRVKLVLAGTDLQAEVSRSIIDGELADRIKGEPNPARISEQE